MTILRFNVEDPNILDIFQFNVQEDCSWIYNNGQQHIVAALIRPERLGFRYDDTVVITLNEDLLLRIPSYSLYNCFTSYIDLIVSEHDAMLIKLSYSGNLQIIDI